MLLRFSLLRCRLLQQQLALESIQLGLIHAFLRGLPRLQRLVQHLQSVLDLSGPPAGLGQLAQEQQPR